ncbi:phage tail tape measure protein [Modestobacter sp. SSW1-42]|uniref:phage tail tape measure protein n=1 Tax=Modestobacter sp. SSW1-42 TaxID=596372 RepID=UPI003985E257
MSTRVLETVLTGRNLLSPVLAQAAHDVTAFNATVARANEYAASSAAASARAQQSAAGLSATAAERAAVASSTGSARQAAAAEKIAASNVRASTSATASASAQMRAHTQAAQSATVSARAQESANRALSAANGMLGTSLTPLTASLGLVGAGLAYAGYRGMEFDAAMSQVQAASQASAGELDQLRDAAVEQGAKTKYSAEEAAQGITEMAKAGVSTADVLNGGLAGALNLAAAGQIDVAEAAETGATALSVFQLKGDQMSHVADLLAAGAGKAQGSVGDLSQALNQSALVASQTGLSIEDTSGALAMFASNGLIGSDAGTSFKTMLQALTPNSKQAAEAMDAIGFSAYDAQGNFVGMEAVAGQLQTGLAGLTQEQRDATLETIFGSDAVRAASVLYKEGAAGVSEWATKVDDAGYAQKQAAQLSDNLKGDLERLGGAFDAAMTSMGGAAQEPLREVVQFLTDAVEVGGDVVSFFTDLPTSAQIAIGAFAGWLAVGDKITEKFSALQGSGDGLFNTFVGSVQTAIIESDGFRDSINNISSAGRSAAVGGLRSLAKAVGPELGFAAATYLVSEFVSGIVDSVNAGKDATQQIEDLNAAIAAAEGNDERFELVNAGLTDMKAEAAEAQSIIDGRNNQNWFNKNVWVGFDNDSTYTNAKKNIELLNNEITRQQEVSARADASAKTLGERYKLSSADVLSFADAHGIDLSGAVDQVQWDFQRLQSAQAGAKGTTNAYIASLSGITPVTDTAVTATQLLGDTSGWTEDQIESATDTITEWRDTLQTVGTSFVEPLELYKTQLDDKTAKEREAADATAAATADSSDSWEDYVTNSSISLSEWAAALKQQTADQDAWRDNIVKITQRGGLEVGQAFAAMGVEGAARTAEMANATDATFNEMATALAEDARRGGSDAAAALDTEMRVMDAVGRAGASATAQSIADELNIGVGTVKGIVSKFGGTIADGVNPVLTALGKPKVNYSGTAILANGRVAGYADGGLIAGPYIGATADNVLIRANPREFMQPVASVDYYGQDFMEALRTRSIPREEIPGYANGGLVTFGKRLEGLGARVTGHSAFGGREYGQHGATSKHYTDDALDVNTRPGTSALEQAELAPMMAMARQLGFRTIFMAEGHYNHGHVDTGAGASMGSGGAPAGISLPKPPSTAPFQAPLSTTADALMQHAHDEATAWLTANTVMPTEGEGGAFTGGGGVEQWRGAVVQALTRTGLPLTDANRTLRRMNQESGGNPRAINNWDVNATRGTPSKGLMQVIDPTFRANRDPGLSADIFDPLANIVASMNYAVGRYGNLARAYDRAGGYANGGPTPAHEPFWVGEQGPELMWRDQQQYVSTAEQSRQLTASPASQPGYGAAGGTGAGGPAAAPPVNVTVEARVFLGDREITDIVRVETRTEVGNAIGGLRSAIQTASRNRTGA